MVPVGNTIVEPFEVQRLHTRTICFAAFAQEEVQIELTGPGEGNRIVERGRSEGQWIVNAGRDMQRGIYQYSVTPLENEVLQAEPITGEITVVPAAQPTALRNSDSVQPSGDIYRIQLAGYDADSRVQVFLYGPANGRGNYPFLRPLAQALIGPDGEATYSWQPSQEDPRGPFIIWFNPGGSVW